MTEEMRKRLEEAAEKTMPEVIRLNYVYTPSYMNGFYSGAEYGYKEAIRVAKEWLEDTLCHYDSVNGVRFVADFEAYMNKLWEEKK